MEINWDRVRRVLLNDRLQVKYKPTKAVFKRIGRILPDAKIFGFSWYTQGNCYALLVESSVFRDNPYGIILDIPIVSLNNYHPPPIYLLPK